MKQDPPLCLEGSPFLENDGIKKRKKKATKYGERGNECFFLHPTKQPTRSGQWTLSSSYDFSAAASCYKSDHPRYENDTAEREINYTVRCTVWSSHESQRPKHLFIQKCCHYVGDNTQTPSGNGQEIFLFLFTSLQGYPVIWLAVRYGVHLAQRNQIRETGFRQHTGALLLAHTPDADQLLLLPREEDLMWPQMFLSTTDRTIVLYLCPFFSLGWSCWLQAKFIRSSSSSSLDITRVQWRDPLCGPGEDVLLAEGTANWAGFWSGSNRVKRWKLSQPSVVFSRPLLLDFEGKFHSTIR